MPVPLNAVAFEDAVDPSDELEFALYLSIGDVDAKPTPMLITGEGVASFAVAPTPEGVAMGLTIMQDDGRAPRLTQDGIIVWCTVADSMLASPLFDGAGVTVGIELTINTDATPPRRKQRTTLIRIANQ